MRPLQTLTALNDRLFARWYPLVCGLSERAGQREMRADLVGQARGRTLEIGAGSGLNLPHYPSAVTELVVTEPSRHMHGHLRRVLAEDPPPVGAHHLVAAPAESLPVEDGSVDTVVGVYVLCTVDDPAAALAEIARVLAPGGRYLFMEHVHAGDGTLLGTVQDLIEPVHEWVAAGCHPNRRLHDLLDAAPLAVEQVESLRMPMAFPTVRPVLRGLAVRP